jgi:prevent-host-death family protein
VPAWLFIAKAKARNIENLVDTVLVAPKLQKITVVVKICASMTTMTIMIFKFGGVNMGTQNWTVAEAKAKFSEVIDRAASEGPQTITRNGHETAVVVGAEEWRRKTKRVGTLVEFFANSPLRGSGLKVRRIKGRLRKIDL